MYIHKVITMYISAINSLLKEISLFKFLAVIFSLLKILKQPDFLSVEEFKLTCHFFFKKNKDLKNYCLKNWKIFSESRNYKIENEIHKIIGKIF